MKSNFERSDIKDWLAQLGKVRRGEHNYPLSRKAIKLLSLPTRSRISVNLYKINRLAKDGDIIFVPGKVLQSGTLERKLKIAALSYTDGAKASIDASGSSMIEAADLIKSKGIKIIT